MESSPQDPTRALPASSEPTHAPGPAYARPGLCRAAAPAGSWPAPRGCWPRALRPKGAGDARCRTRVRGSRTVVTQQTRHGLVVHFAGPPVMGTAQDGRVATTATMHPATSRQALDHGAAGKKPASAMTAAMCRDPARAKGPVPPVTGALPHLRGHPKWSSRSRFRVARCQSHVKREAASFAPFACGREACGSRHLLRAASAHDELRIADRALSP